MCSLFSGELLIGCISIREELEDIYGIFDNLGADVNNQITLNKKAHKEVQRQQSLVAYQIVAYQIVAYQIVTYHIVNYCDFVSIANNL